jgi:hypothetical protein
MASGAIPSDMRGGRHGCAMRRPRPPLLRFGRESNPHFVCVRVVCFVVLQPRCGVVVDSTVKRVCFFLPLFLWYSLDFRGSPSLSPSSSLRGIVGTVRYVLDLWIIW